MGRAILPALFIMRKNVAIVHFNTPELTRAEILSLWKNTPDCSITVFDNSDKRPFVPMDGVRVIDNTKGQIINFEKELAKYPDKTQTRNEWASAKHAMSVDYLFDVLSDGFVLSDSDVLFKKDISDIFDLDAIVSGSISTTGMIPRLRPFLCWINVPICKRYGIRYFDGKRSWHLCKDKRLRKYDTGASFLEDCQKSGEYKRIIALKDYIEHLGAGSWQETDWRKWLEEHKNLYNMEEEKKKTVGRPKKTATTTVNQEVKVEAAPAKEEPKKEKIDISGKVLVVIPYLAKEAQGRELEYAVAGWRKHFKENYLIVLVGDHHPVADSGDDIYFINCPRVTPIAGEYTCHLDHVKKFRRVMDEFPEAEGFIYTCDDIYAVNDFDLVDVKFLKVREYDIKVNANTINEWAQNNAKTKARLIQEGLPVRNYVCHLPVYYECKKLKAIYDRFKCDSNSYVVEQLYFNTYFPRRVPLVLDIDYDNLLCGVRRPNPRVWYIEEALKKKIWLQNSVDGWIPAFENILKKHYGI